jgi:hypothetical protein
MSAAPVSESASSLGTFARTDAASISANNLTNGIYWLMHNTGELIAFDATNLNTVLWTSGQNGGRDSPGSATKFAPPTIANGMVYIGNSTALVGYGLLNGTTPPPPPPPVVTASPTFSPSGGTFTVAQSVTISDATAGASIFFTTDGTTPTTASKAYTGPVSVSTTETLNALAVASGDSPSAVTSSTYTINTNGGSGGTGPGGGGGTNPPVVNDPSGFASAAGFTLDGGATVTGNALQLADGGTFENRTVWYTTPLNIQSFSTNFTFQITPASTSSGDGFTFTIQNMGLSADGGIGGALGYQSITPSVAVKFDLFDNSARGPIRPGSTPTGPRRRFPLWT